MTRLTEDDVQSYALDLALDYLQTGPEFIAIAETAYDEGWGDDEDFIRQVHDRINKILAELAGNL